jgi:hypothetical protein
MCKLESAYQTDDSINPYQREKISFLIVIYVQNWTPIAWTAYILWAVNMYKVESAFNEETSCQIQ